MTFTTGATKPTKLGLRHSIPLPLQSGILLRAVGSQTPPILETDNTGFCHKAGLICCGQELYHCILGTLHVCACMHGCQGSVRALLFSVMTGGIQGTYELQLIYALNCLLFLLMMSVSFVGHLSGDQQREQVSTSSGSDVSVL